MKRFMIYEKDVAINAMLYIIEKNGGLCDMHRIFKTLYFADREHMAHYGKSITKDAYIAMKYGPVPSCTDDILKAVRGDSYFSYAVDDFTPYFEFLNRYTLKALKPFDPDYLSVSAIKCLNYAIDLCKGLTFDQLTSLSHDLAWNNTLEGHEISVADMMREKGEEEGYALYVESQRKAETALLI